MSRLFESIFEIETGAGAIISRRYGVIEVAEAKLVAVHFRPWPKLISTMETHWLGGWQHAGRRRKDQCLMYFNQPVGHSNFLALKYAMTSFGTTFGTVRKALLVLDQIAFLKKSDAIVAEITNPRISDRALERLGWEKHFPKSRKRNFIRRFYGHYPAAIIESVTVAITNSNPSENS